MLRIVARLCAVVALLGLPAVAAAGPVAIEFSVVSSIAGPVTGSGWVITDEVNLAPNAQTLNFADLIDMSMTLNGIPSAPSVTTFSRANLDAPNFSWILAVNGAGAITDLNFFMRLGGTNSDGYAIDGFSPFNFVLCQGPAAAVSCGNSPQLDRLRIRVDQVRPVPEPATLSLIALGALGGRRMLRRRAS